MCWQATLEREGVQQLQCFRHLPHQLTEASEAVQQLMASDLLSLLHFHGLSHLQDHILAGIMEHQEYLASGSVMLCCFPCLPLHLARHDLALPLPGLATSIAWLLAGLVQQPTHPFLLCITACCKPLSLCKIPSDSQQSRPSACSCSSKLFCVAYALSRSHSLVYTWPLQSSSCFLPCRPPLERGQYRLQSEDGSVPALESASSRVSEAFSNVPADPLGDVVSLGRAAVQGMQPDAAESNELSQLVTPLVLGNEHLASTCWSKQLSSRWLLVHISKRCCHIEGSPSEITGTVAALQASRSICTQPVSAYSYVNIDGEHVATTVQ